MTISLEQLHAWMSDREDEHLEFKEAKSDYDFEKLVRYCVALANERGGRIILGITDVLPRRVVGSQAYPDLERTKAGLYERLQIRVEAEALEHPDGRVVVFSVPSRPLGVPVHCKGAYWMRAGGDLVPMTPDQLKRILDEAMPDFSAQVCDRATLSDLDPSALRAFRTRWSQKAGSPRLLTLSDEQTLIDNELLVNGSPTYAALILFGQSHALGRYLAQAEVIFEYRSSEAAGPAQDRIDYRLGFFLFHDALWERVNLRNDRQSYQDGLFRFDIPTFDEAVVREAVLNAVCHRDYRLQGSVFVRQYARRLEVTSPGGLPAGVTVENILDQQVPRNRRLAEACARCGLVERSGQGMNLIFERTIRHSKPLPSFERTSGDQVWLTLHGTVGNPAFVRFLERVGQDKLQSFSTADFMILDSLQLERPVPPSLRPLVQRLVDLGVIEMIGRGRGTRYTLSRALYTAIGQPAAYTRQKGLDRSTNKELLVRHLEHRFPMGCALQELRQVLPHIPRRTIQLYLQELRRERRIRLEGTRSGSLWYAERTQS